MEDILCTLVGLAIGGAVAWLLASARATKSLAVKLEESERQAARLEATIDELRKQHQQISDDLAELRDQLVSETSARVKAETQLAEALQRLEEEKSFWRKPRTNSQTPSRHWQVIPSMPVRSHFSNWLKKHLIGC